MSATVHRLAPSIAFFERFKATYPRRQGSNPWQPARKSFERALRDGADPEEIIAAAGRYQREQRDLKHIDTPFVCQAVTWLNQQRWLDYPAPQEVVASTEWVSREDSRWPALAKRWTFQHNGMGPPTVSSSEGPGWYFPTSWAQEKGGGAFAHTSPAGTIVSLNAGNVSPGLRPVNGGSPMGEHGLRPCAAEQTGESNSAGKRDP